MTLKRYDEAIEQWMRLEDLQKELYGDKSQNLIMTWKKMGICYLAGGNSLKSRKCFLDSVEVLKRLPVEEDRHVVKLQD